MHLRIYKVVLLTFFLVMLFPTDCYGQDEIDDYLGEFNYTQVDETIADYTEIDLDFQSLVKDIISVNHGNLSIRNYIEKVGEMLNANKRAAIEILILGVLSALLKNFAQGLGEKQISDTSQMMIGLSLITILAAVFAGAVQTSIEVLEVLIHFYQSICPIFFPTVIAAGGSLTAAAYYEIVMMMITAVDVIFKNILIPINGIYMLLGIADSVGEEEHFSKACEMAQGIMKYVCRTVLTVFLGLSGIKGMITPFLDSEKRNLLYRTISLIPGVGNTASAVSKTMLGAGTIVKNSMGVATVILVIVLSAMPLMKLIVLTILYKTIAAILEPVAGHGMVHGINLCSKAVGNLVEILLVTMALFIMTIGIICMTSNGAYLSS